MILKSHLTSVLFLFLFGEALCPCPRFYSCVFFFVCPSVRSLTYTVFDGRSKGACVTNTVRRSVESAQPAQFPHPRTALSHPRVRRDAGARFYGGLGGGNAVERSDSFVRRSSRLHEQGKRHLQVPRFRGPLRFRVGWPAFPNRLKGNALLRATKADCRASRVALCGVSVRAYSIHIISLTLSCSKPDIPQCRVFGKFGPAHRATRQRNHSRHCHATKLRHA